MASLAELLARVDLGGERFVVSSIRRRRRDPFKVLVGIVLSQNTSDANAIRAFRRLEERVGVDPERLAEAPLEVIEDAVRPAGLYKRRAWVIKNLARVVLERYGGDLWSLLRKPWREARKELLGIPGIGVKTADVLLANFVSEAEVLAVDTHINRVSKRLGIVGPRAGYEEISSRLIELLRGKIDLLEAHLKLIAVGRRYCKPRRPRCWECPLREVCSYAQARAAGDDAPR